MPDGGVELATAYVALKADGTQLGPGVKKSLGGVEAEAGRVGTRSGRRLGAGLSSAIGTSAKRAAVGVGAAFAAIRVKDFLTDSVAEARESQKVGALSAQVIKTTGGVANVTAGQVGKLATAISNKTGIDDEAIQAGENMLLTFKNIRNEAGKGNKIFDQSTRVLTDYAAVMKKDPSKAAIQLGKALNDPVKGITALGKAGVTFTDKQKDRIAKFVEEGKILSAQKMILRELKSEFGGAAAASSTAGEKASVGWANLKEQLGTALLPTIDRVEGQLSKKVIPAASKFIDQMQSGKGPGGEFADTLGDVADAGKDVVKAGKGVLDFVNGLPGPVKKYGAEAAIALGIMSKLVKVGKGIPGLGALGGKAAGALAVSSKPVPVYVTNMGGLAGTPGGAAGTAAAGSKGATAGRLVVGAVVTLAAAKLMDAIGNKIAEIGDKGNEKGPLKDFKKPKDDLMALLAGSGHTLKHDAKAASNATKFGGIGAKADQALAGLVGGDSLTKSLANVKQLDVNLSKLNFKDPAAGAAAYGQVLKKTGLTQEQLNQILPKTTKSMFGQAKATGGVRDALFQTIPRLANYDKRLKTLPAAVRTKVETPGAVASMQDVRALARQYNLTPKQVRTLIALTGAKPAKTATDALITSLTTADRKNARPKVQQQGAGPSKALVDGLRSSIDRLRDKTVTVHVNRSVGGAAFNAGAGFLPAGGRKAPGRAGGGPVRAGYPYTVGEYRREVFVPSTSGRLVANPAVGGAGGGPVILHMYDEDGELMATMSGVADERYHANQALG